MVTVDELAHTVTHPKPQKTVRLFCSLRDAGRAQAVELRGMRWARSLSASSCLFEKQTSTWSGRYVCRGCQLLKISPPLGH